MHPFQISVAENKPMNAFDLSLQIGGFTTKEEARKFADALVEWIKKNTGPKTWSETVQ